MNLGCVGNLIGRFGLMLAGLLLLPLLVCAFDGTLTSHSAQVFAATALGTAIVALSLLLLCRFDQARFELPEAFAAVTAAWLTLFVVGALPFVLTGSIPSGVDALFESVSGATTTGASILPDPALLGRPLLFWRALLVLLGGVGIVALSVAVLPALGAGGNALFQAESSGPEKSKLLPRIADVSKMLWMLYLGLTVVTVGALALAGMTPFDALCHGFALVGTGGYSTRADSFNSYSPAIQWTASVLMLVASTNFLLLLALVRGRGRTLLNNAEWRVYVAWVFGAMALALAVRLASEGVPSDVEAFARGTVFSVVSVASTTGFSTVDFNAWAPPLHLLLIALMLVGGCSGSTAGGFKPSRLVLWFKACGQLQRQLLRPSSVVVAKSEGRTIERTVIFKSFAFLGVALAVFVILSVALVGLGLSEEAAFSATASCLGGVGPGLDAVGPTLTYAPLPDAAKLLLCLAMLLGRLEYFALLVLLLPQAWRR
ncbi:MAG: TrkH family potassium uptake protein [Planctomycetota bacterium]